MMINGDFSMYSGTIDNGGDACLACAGEWDTVPAGSTDLTGWTIAGAVRIIVSGSGLWGGQLDVSGVQAADEGPYFACLHGGLVVWGCVRPAQKRSRNGCLWVLAGAVLLRESRPRYGALPWLDVWSRKWRRYHANRGRPHGGNELSVIMV